MRRQILTGFLAGLLSWSLVLGTMAQTPTPIPQADDAQETFLDQVRVGPILLFPIESKLGSISIQERAQVISDRLKKLADDPKFRAESIQSIPEGEERVLRAGDQVIMVVTQTDAQQAQKDPSTLAQSYVQRLRSGVRQYQQSYGEKTLMRRGIYAGVITVIWIGLLTLLHKLVPRLHRKIESLKGTRIRPLQVQNLELLSEDQIVQVCMFLVNGIKLPILLGLLYLYLLSVLSLFPWTQDAARVLIHYILTALQTIWNSMVDYLPNLVFIVVICVLSLYVVRFCRFFMSAVERGLIGFPGFDREWSKPTFQILRFLIIAVAVTLSIPYLPGSSSPAVQGMSIFFGILVSLGSTAVAANVVAGLALTYTRAFKIGDRVEIAETVGDVIEKTFLVTQIRTPKNMVVTIPNSRVLGDQIVNYSAHEQGEGLILHTPITLGYDVPWTLVHKVLIEAAIATPGVLHDPKPFVLQKGLEDFYVSYELNAHTREPTRMTKIYSELHQNIQDRCNEHGIEILSPHYGAMRDGNEVTIPETYRAQSYQAPGFRITQIFPSSPSGPPSQIEDSK
ncbi:mechanosensitive ion channel family protein [Lyngbya confervoides]|uniref:Mechanosensitive ion channel n=1 Tax=Lyngbya confervoides BDU141951 TaxID=1574623 RepID=A0ABD4T001_9CYAN|nr:mechanosensitive ion channel family protein [Lyngbya confervoides]MCM1981848.1 mechanosensitive ion channel [Lyngbya confervoides BDU141951]